MIRPTSWTGFALGILVFLLGIGMIAFAFALAFQMFNTPPEQALVKPNQTDQGLDLAGAGSTFIWQIFRFLALLVMGGLGSAIANRGVKMFAESRKILDNRPAE